jgi:hypothetical protein
MKLKRLAYLISIFIFVTAVGNFLQAGGDSRKYSENYPELVCPNIGGAQSQVSLITSKRLVRFLPAKNFKFVPAKTTRLLTKESSVIVDGMGTSSMAWISKAGIWAGGVNCLAPQAEQFFVGATADVTSKAKLVIINAGLSSSIVDVTTFSDGASLKKTVTVGKNQVSTLNVVSLAPGAKSVAMQVVPRTGRVTSYLVDERGRGLKTLGGDVVNSQSQLFKTLQVPGIPHSQKSKTHILRVLNPGAASSVISVEVVSKDGRYIPVGLDGRKVAAGKVTDIPVNFDSNQSSFGLKITSDQPIAASVYSQIGNDFTWSSAVNSGLVGTWSITGLDPTLQLIGNEINTSVVTLLPGGKKVTKNLSGADYLTYQVPKGALGIRITKTSGDIAASLIVYSQSGVGFLPLVNGSQLTRSTVPTANIGVLNP